MPLWGNSFYNQFSKRLNEPKQHSGHKEEEKNLLPLLVMKQLNHPASNIITKLTMLSWLHLSIPYTGMEPTGKFSHYVGWSLNPSGGEILRTHPGCL